MRLLKVNWLAQGHTAEEASSTVGNKPLSFDCCRSGLPPRWLALGLDLASKSGFKDDEGEKSPELAAHLGS